MIEPEAFVRRNLAILKRDAIDGASRKAVHDPNRLNVSGDADDLYVAHNRKDLCRRSDGRHHAPLQIEFEGLLGAIQLDVAIGDIFNHSSAAGLRLESNWRPVARIEDRVAHLHVADSA